MIAVINRILLCVCHGVLSCLLFIASSFAADAEIDPKTTIWIEGETPLRSTMNRHPWWYDQVKKEVLSGGDWISNFHETKEGTAVYSFEVATADTYAFWVRANPSVDARLEWELDDGSWSELDFKTARGNQNIAADNKPDMRFLAWVKGGDIALSMGRHTIAFRMRSGAKRSNHGGLDCFVFTRIPFVPAGKQKPGARVEAGPGDWFPLLADDDPFDPRSVIDMSSLIPAPAGQFGFLRAVNKDLRFEKQDAPVKLWGCGANLEYGRLSRDQLTSRIRYLRKFGINAVRQHPVFDEVTTRGVLDPKKLDAFDWYFAELKKHGLYMDWSVFYHFTIGPDDGYDPALYAELEGKERKDTYGFISVSPKLWEIRTKWLVALLQHKNPYTGLRYCDDPALAIVEMQNEESVFFWNPLGWIAEGRKAPLHSKELRHAFAQWTRKKYKTDAELKNAWGELRHGDSVTAEELRLMGPWELDGPGPRGPFAGLTKRAGDYIQFLTEMQRALFDQCEAAIRTAGFRAVTVTTAWQVGGASTEAANIYTDTAASMIDRHNYAGGGEGVHGIKEGKVNHESHLAHPGGGIFSIAMKQVEQKPFGVSEWTQSPPNQWKLESAPIMAFYGIGLHGWDSSFHFTQSGTRLGDGWPDMSSYRTDTPHYIGQFPALAFAIHKGHIKESPPIAARHLTTADLFTGSDALQQDFTKGGYDAKSLVNTGGVPPEFFAIGRITVSFDGAKTQQTDAAKYWMRDAKTVRAVTGELIWDYGRELITVQSPKTQAMVGRPGSEEVTLPAVTIRCETPFVSVIFTPLDDLPLVESKHILITALARDKQSGALYSDDGTRLETVGTAPLLLEPVQAAIKLRGARPAKVRPLDHYGVPIERSVPIGNDGAIAIDGTQRAYYYEVTR